jgi:hypothetical protein
MRFDWFWTFWHWSKESFRDGSLLRSPLHGIGSHWDEWFRHEASEGDLRAIEEAGRTKSTQRRFIAWLIRHWARETDWPRNRMVWRFVLGQLAHLPPFDKWQAFENYRAGYGVGGISAVVLGAESPGQAEDVRRVEALALPADGAPTIVPEGFQADAGELETARCAARSVLCGKGLLVFFALWMACGHRPYPRWLKIAMALSWLAVGGLILYLLVGPEPGEQLFLWTATLTALWSGLMLVAVTVAAWQGFRAWRQGAVWASRLDQCQIRIRMNGGLTIKGESAGLPFCLNTLLAVSGVETHSRCRSWLWQQFIGRPRSETDTWAATGVVTAHGRLKPVVLEPKLRACLRHDGIKHILTPRQRDGGQRAIDRLATAATTANRPDARASSSVGAARFGFAAEKLGLRNHSCRHVAQSMMALGGFADSWQIAANVFALIVSAILVTAASDLRNILLPYPAPVAVTPASSSPYYLWVSLDTKHPEYFSAVLESSYWSNRRSEVKQRGGVTPSVRAEIHLHRLTGMTAASEEDGVVWIERRRRFLSREFLPGERVGRYSIPYLSRLGHE